MTGCRFMLDNALTIVLHDAGTYIVVVVFTHFCQIFYRMPLFYSTVGTASNSGIQLVCVLDLC